VSVNERSFQDKEPTKEHTILVSGLLPGNVYNYRVTFNGYASRPYSFQNRPQRRGGSTPL